MTVTLDAVSLAIVSVRARREREMMAPAWLPEPHQVPPSGAWMYWLLMAGRGSGKTDAGAHFVDAHARGAACIPGPQPHRIGVIAPTIEDARDVCISGVSGLLRANPAIRYRPGSRLFPELTWPNGAAAATFGAFTPEDIERMRGPQHCLLWCEEFAAWRKLDDVWPMARLGLRLGSAPRAIFTTTPKPRRLLKEIMREPGAVVTTATTDHNPHLAAEVRAELYRIYGGTRLGRQELSAEILDDVPGALWTRGMIELGNPSVRADMQTGAIRPDLSSVVVAIDPAVTATTESDETGIIVAGRGVDGRGYILADRSCRLSPDGWARRAVAAYDEFRADRIVAEANQGGDMVGTVIRTVRPSIPLSIVHATRGKAVRAQPVAALYEQGRVSHSEPFPALEDQLCGWTPESGDSPDRLDALVWAVTDLFAGELASDSWGAGSWGGSIGAASA